MEDGRVIVDLPSRPENVSLARVIVAAFAARLDFTVAETEEISVAVSEAVSNSVIHGYGNGPGRIRLEMSADGEMLEVVVADRGAGIANVDQARQPAFTTREDRMGLGFVFMESFMDELQVCSAPGEGTKVTMRKRPEREATDGAATGQRLSDK
ncbi:MAG: anti-sigma F factor [Patescibacteria group bacterium]